MDDLARAVLARLPLAEAVLLVWSWIAEESFLQDLFQRHRGRCYEKLLAFPILVHLIADALLEHGGSARQAFERADEVGALPASIQAAYQKLGRLPVPLSRAFLAGCTERLQALFPDIAAVTLPASLRRFAPVVLDGKAIKRVAKRLKPLRRAAGGVLGGRALVALTLANGLAVAMHAHPDGDANDVRFTPQLLPEVRRRVGGLRLWIADRQFCTLKQLAEFVAAWDHFLVRYHAQVQFARDQPRPVRAGQDAAGRPYEEEWGWLGSPSHRQRRYVRRITLRRPGEEAVSVVTDLLDGDKYPAVDLLEAYLARWGVERMFQQVTEVFGLQSLIGGRPEAAVFQFAFCLVLYNLIQVVRAYVAVAHGEAVAEISTEKLFGDVTRQLIAWEEVVAPEATVSCFREPLTAAVVRARLERLLREVWTERWRKSPAQKRRPPEAKARKRTHGSVYRILEKHRRRQRLKQNE
jgi:hypothetical protein